MHRYSLAKVEAYLAVAEENELADALLLAQAYHDPKGLSQRVQTAGGQNARPMGRKDAERLRQLAKGKGVARGTRK